MCITLFSSTKFFEDNFTIDISIYYLYVQLLPYKIAFSYPVKAVENISDTQEVEFFVLVRLMI